MACLVEIVRPALMAHPTKLARQLEQTYHGTTCETCGQVHQTENGMPTCLGHKANGQRCTRDQPPDSFYCRYHRPVTEQRHKKNVISAKKVTSAVAQIKRLASELDTNADPVELLRMLIRRSHAAVEWYAEELGKIEERDPELLFHVRTIEESTGSKETYRRIILNPEIAIPLREYNREREHLANLIKLAAAIGLRERELDLVQFEISLVQSLVTKLLDSPELSLTLEQQQMARTLMISQLESIESHTFEPGVYAAR